MSAGDSTAIADWLAAYDRAAADAIPEPRRSSLRSELAEHLDEALEPDATEAQIAEVLAALGSPHAIVEEELRSPAVAAPRRALVIPRPRPLVVVAVAVFVVAVILAGIWVFTEKPTAIVGEPRNVVTTDPDGPARTTDGRAYQEYLTTIEGLGPLPPGASWPYGVPEGLDAGPTDDGEGIMAAGAGVVTASFTWGCAWEYEYLLAEKAGDNARLVAAYDAIVEYGDSPMMQEASPDGGWIDNVIGPLQFEDASGLKQDVVQTCEQAGITGLYNLVFHPEG